MLVVKDTRNKPHMAQFRDLEVGAIFLHSDGYISIKTTTSEAIAHSNCLLYNEETKSWDMGYENGGFEVEILNAEIRLL